MLDFANRNALLDAAGSLPPLGGRATIGSGRKDRKGDSVNLKLPTPLAIPTSSSNGWWMVGGAMEMEMEMEMDPDRTYLMLSWIIPFFIALVPCSCESVPGRCRSTR